MASADERREAFRKFMEARRLNPNALARGAGFSTSAIYNFMSGVSDSLSSSVLAKIAAFTGSSIDEILTGAISNPIPVRYRIGSGARMFPVDEDEGLTVATPPGVSGDGVSAALVDGDGLHPIPSGWTVFFESEASEPGLLIGKLAVVRWSGGGDRPVVRTLRRGSQPGTFTLQALNGTLIEDVEVVAAHKVVSLSAPS